MTVGLLLRRLNQLPHIEGVARALAARGHRAALLLAPMPGAGKAWLRPEPTRVPARWREWAEICPLDKSPALDALVVPAPLGDLGPLPPAHVRAALQTSVSDLLALGEPKAWDVIYGWSEAWRGFWAQGQRWASFARPSHEFDFERRFVAVGMPLAEHLTWTDPEEVRKAYGLPPGPSVLYLPFPFGAHRKSWRLRWGYRLSPWGDRATVRAVRRYADRVGAQLVVALRRKVDNPGYVRAAADVVVEGEAAEPTVLRLLTCARLLVHHLSSAVAEAAAAGVPAMGVLPDGWTAYKGRGEAFEPARDSWMDGCHVYRFYDWPAVAHTVSPRQARWLAGGPQLPTIGQADRAAYLARFVGGEPFQTGARIVEDLERRCG